MQNIPGVLAGLYSWTVFPRRSEGQAMQRSFLQHHRPRFLTRPPSLSLGVYFLSSRARAFNHECNIVVIPYSLSSLALDGSREPRRDVGRTGEISKDWLASTES
jgi:hypothetical protein